MSVSRHLIRPGTYESIMEAAVAALTADPAASMSAIAVKAGVGRATLHRHFPTREDLTTALALYCIEETNLAVAAVVQPEQTALIRLENTLSAIIPLGDRYSFISRTLIVDDAVLEAYRAQLRWLRDLISDLKTEEQLDSRVPETWVLAMVDQIIWSAWEQISRGHLSKEEAPALAFQTLLQGLGADRNRSASSSRRSRRPNNDNQS